MIIGESKRARDQVSYPEMLKTNVENGFEYGLITYWKK